MASTKPGVMSVMALSSAGAAPLTFSTAGAASTASEVGPTVTLATAVSADAVGQGREVVFS